jgi:RHS repeat-associated protein
VADTYTYSPANELLSITSSLNNSTNPANLVSNVQNGPFGPTSWHLGNNFNALRQYDQLGRVEAEFICNGPAQPSCQGGSPIYYYSVGWTGPYAIGSCDYILNDCSNYGYDQMGRLISSTVSLGASNNYTWTYDRWGNRWAQTGGYSYNPTFNTANNQISSVGSTGYVYDAAGNLIADGTHSYTYDAEGNLTKVDNGNTASYSYDSLNQRIATTEGSTQKEFVFNPAGQRISIWQPVQGALGTQIQGQTYWGGVPVEFYKNGQAHFQHQDWLGTERTRTSYNGGVEGTYTSLPFGDALTTTSGTDLDPYHYAGLDHDYSSDTDHAQFRQYANIAGRWMSPDVFRGSYDFANPQSLDRYTYALNQPLALTDPSGMDPVCSIDPLTGLLECTSYYDGGDDIGGFPLAESDGGGEYIPCPASPTQGKCVNTMPILLSTTFGGSKPKNWPLDPNSQECKDLANKIQRLANTIADKENKIATNPWQLPEFAPPGSPPSESVQGHRDLLQNYIQALADNTKLYNDKCGGGQSSSGSGATSPSSVASGSPSSSTTKKVIITAGVITVVVGTVILCPECLAVAPLLAP